MYLIGFLTKNENQHPEKNSAECRSQIRSLGHSAK